MNYFEDSDVCCADILTLTDKLLANSIIPESVALKSERRMFLESQFSALHDECLDSGDFHVFFGGSVSC